MSIFNMQNVFLWIKPDEEGGFKFRYRKFPEYADNSLKLQIENSLFFGWPKEDIIVATNFPFEHMGVKAFQVEDICRWSSFANKLVVVNEMIKRGVINNNFWFHDADAFQLESFSFPEHCSDVGFTRHAPGRPKPQGGSSFYRKEAYDIVEVVSAMVRSFKVEKEESFFPAFYDKEIGEKSIRKWMKKVESTENTLKAIHENPKKYRAGSIRKAEKALKNRKHCYEEVQKYFGKFADRFTWLDWTYGLFRVSQFTHKYSRSEKPIKVAHFHPNVPACMDCFCYGKNGHNVKVVPDRLVDLFKKYDLIDYKGK